MHTSRPSAVANGTTPPSRRAFVPRLVRVEPRHYRLLRQVAEAERRGDLPRVAELWARFATESRGPGAESRASHP
jgi:hypothetical protein